MSRLERLRNSASSLVRQLRQARAESLARQAETDRADPMTQIRGRSAMDDAVTEAEGLLARLEMLIAGPGTNGASINGISANGVSTNGVSGHGAARLGSANGSSGASDGTGRRTTPTGATRVRSGNHEHSR